MSTKIEWTRNADGSEGETWNPIRARNRGTGKQGHYCQKISPGCKNCYAESMNRWRGNGVAYTVPGLEQVELYLDAEALLQPLRWRKPRNIFVCSMTDLFADFVSDEWIDLVYAVMRLAFQHTFMVLTKRPERRLRYLSEDERFVTIDDSIADDFVLKLTDSQDHRAYEAMERYDAAHSDPERAGYSIRPWPLPNVREGLSVCTQTEADDLIPLLLQTPATLRWLSMEPLLEAVSLRWKNSTDFGTPHPRHLKPNADERGRVVTNEYDGLRELDWVVVGGESGRSARDTDIAHIRSVVSQCKSAGVPVFVKQLGTNAVDQLGRMRGAMFGDYKGGNIDEWPLDLRVRELPAMATEVR
jgi:protein gp37